MTMKYDISQFGRSWCLNDHLETRQNFFLFINFENPFKKLLLKMFLKLNFTSKYI